MKKNKSQRLTERSSINTLIPDIQELLVSGDDNIPEELYEEFGKAVVETLKKQLSTEKHPSRLRMSNIGNPCERKLYYSVNNSDEGEQLNGGVLLKFLYGHLIEELMLSLAKMTGHKVEGEQDEAEINGIKGHRDCVIDGVLVDVKSASSFSFKKFKDGKLATDDPFGYITQLQGYLHHAQDDPLVKEKGEGAFWVIDKVLGHQCLDFHEYKKWPLEDMYQRRKDMVAKDTPPERGFDPVPDGVSGNMKLGMFCGYCSHKQLCHPNLRTFLYAGPPKFLTTVKKLPNVPEA